MPKVWIAKKEQTIKRGLGYVTIKPGDPVPEAENWPNREMWIQSGYIKCVVRDEDPPKKEPVSVKVEQEPIPEPIPDPVPTSKPKKKAVKKTVKKKSAKKEG
jgi:hypothetical protein